MDTNETSIDLCSIGVSFLKNYNEKDSLRIGPECNLLFVLI